MTDTDEPVEEAAAAPAPADPYRVGAIVLAILWSLMSVIVAIVLMTTKEESYGGDAYTGIQNAIIVAVRGIAWLLIGSGVLGLIVALRPRDGSPRA